MNWLFLMVSLFIPVVGPIVATGWLIRCFVAWHHNRPTPDFNFNYFGDYLKEGLWPFLVSLTYSFAALIIFLPLFFGGFFFLASGDGSGPDSGSHALFLILFIFLSEMIALSLLNFITTPAIIRSALLQDYKSGFSRAFIFDFLKRCWGPILLSQIGYFALACLAIIVGYLALFIGVYFTMSLMMFVHYHLLYQVYQSHLAKGGDPLTIHPSLLPPTPPALPSSGGPSSGD